MPRRNLKRSLPLAWLLASVMAGPGVGAGVQPLTDEPGDPVRGLEIIRDTSRASCLICHQFAGLDDRGQGEIGPPLENVGAIYDAADLRQRVMDAREISPDTLMPPYYSTEGLYRVGEEWKGQTIYAAQDVEDVVAFLLTLKD